MLSILQATTPDHQAAVHDLFKEYLNWASAEIQRQYNAIFDPAAILDHDMAELHIFLPPGGRLLLAYADSAAAGCACVRANNDRIAELKRMYVHPSHRRKGIGRALVDAVIKEVRLAGYSTLRLDSAGFMTDAHALYRSFGFQDIAPYPESEIPEEFRVHWVFMQLSLGDGKMDEP
jgi:GNAT superfamily N-acetyltransferase